METIVPQNFIQCTFNFDELPQKRCSKCKQTKPINSFNNNRTRPDGKGDRCKTCIKNFRKPKIRKEPRPSKKPYIKKNAPTIILTCACCSEEFYKDAYKYNARTKNGKARPFYCTKKCAAEANKAKQATPLPPSIGEEYIQGKTLLCIASQYNTSESVVWQRLKKMGIATRPSGSSGNSMRGKHHTTETVEKIREASHRQFSSEEARVQHGHYTRQRMIEGKISRVSKLEDIVAQELSRRGIAFIRQYGVNGTNGKYCACLDFMLADGRGIEVNGTFWHTDPRKYPNGPIYTTQKEVAENYTRKMTNMAKLNITIIELWEIDLRADLVGTLDKAL